MVDITVNAPNFRKLPIRECCCATCDECRVASSEDVWRCRLHEDVWFEESDRPSTEHICDDWKPFDWRSVVGV